LPSIGLSLLMDKNLPDYDHVAQVCLDSIRMILDRGIRPGEMVNVNVPALRAPQQPKGTRVVRQCTRPWNDQYEKRLTPTGNAYYWNTAKFALHPDDDDTDVAALREGYVTITPLMFDLTDRSRLAHWTGHAD
jgi:5'-nucleotidase